MPPEESAAARVWFTQAGEDLAAARLLAGDAAMPDRLAAFLAHLAAEKAMKGALIARGIVVRKIHDLVELQSSLTESDAASISSGDVDVLVPWNIAGRYPADLDQAAPTSKPAVEAAGRIVEALTNRIYPAE